MENLIHGKGVPLVTAYGDSDDHLRLTVLIAEVLRSAAPDAAKVCLTATNNSWSARYSALRELLRAARLTQSKPEVVLRVRDTQALPEGEPSGFARWDDATFARERSQLHGLLARESREGVVALVGAVGDPDATDVLERFHEDLRPLALWLRDAGHVDEATLAGYIRRERPEHVLTVMWDVIERHAREAALRLSAFRAPQRLNGVFGPLTLCTTPVDGVGLASVSRAAVDTLLEMGLLRPVPGTPGEVEFPRLVRTFLRAFATVYSPADLQGDHKTIADKLPEASTETVIERHHHAVLGRDATLARSTARFYGADLRTIAREASLDGDHPTAAALYEEIVTHFDPRDAYAWEYLGYNLWRPFWRNLHGMPDGLRTRVDEALVKACTVDPANARNPLFIGRLLGFRGALGQNVSTEFARRVRVFKVQLRRGAEDRQSSLSWMAEQVRSAFASVGAQDRYTQLCQPWRNEEQVYRVLTQSFVPRG